MAGGEDMLEAHLHPEAVCHGQHGQWPGVSEPAYGGEACAPPDRPSVSANSRTEASRDPGDCIR